MSLKSTPLWNFIVTYFVQKVTNYSKNYDKYPKIKTSCLAGRNLHWCRRAESNRRHEDFQSSALPTELPRHIKMATLIGFEPTISAVTGRHVRPLHHRAVFYQYGGR